MLRTRRLAKTSDESDFYTCLFSSVFSKLKLRRNKEVLSKRHSRKLATVTPIFIGLINSIGRATSSVTWRDLMRGNEAADNEKWISRYGDG